MVLHYTAMESAVAALDRLCDPAFEVSAHYLIGIDGMLWQMVCEKDRAWHAGAGEWQGRGDVNSRSIGIELDNRGTHPFSAPQMQVLEALLADIMARHRIDSSGIIGHSDMAPGRKGDPGRHFDWARLARQGLALAAGSALGIADPDAPDPEEFRRLAAIAGFPATAPDNDLLDAVRLRFRPWARGPLQVADVKALRGAK